MTLAALPSPNFTGADLAARVNAGLQELRAGRRFATVAALMADTTLAYGTGARAVAEGDAIEAGGHCYAVAASGASDHHLTTAGGVRLYALAPYSPEQFGAAGDGLADDLAAINAMTAARPNGPFVMRGTYRVSTYPQPTVGAYEFHGGSEVTIDGGLTWNPRRRTYLRDTTTARRTNTFATNPVTAAPASYTRIESSRLHDDHLINQWGKQAYDATGGTVARTGVNLRRGTVLHAGEGDCYVQGWDMGVTAHPNVGLATDWGGQNSGGLSGGQASANTDKVNLYGIGDMVLDDNGYADVAMLGHVTYLDRDGADSGAYQIPRLGHYIRSRGAMEIDAGFIFSGKAKVGFDATGGSFSGAALALAGGQKITFDGGLPPYASGKFSVQDVGAYYLTKPTGQTALEVGRGADDAYLWRVAGASASVRAAMGVSGTGAYVSAMSTGADSTFLVLRTANGGTEADAVTIGSTGNLSLSQAGAVFRVGSTPVVGARKTGWAAPTGTATRTAFDTATVTTAQLAERLKGLLDDLSSHGLIGA